MFHKDSNLISFALRRGGKQYCRSSAEWANVGHALDKALCDDNIGPGLDRVHKQYWAKIGATRVAL